MRKLALKWAYLLGVLFIVLVAIIPLFFNLPFRDNIYLSWEGAYRMYSGLKPFKDFGIPLGYVYWILPTLSFYLFGPYLISLVKIQVVINIISGITFMKIVSSTTKNAGILLVCVVIYVLSFSFYNFWPWYNHTVIVYEFVAIMFLLIFSFSEKRQPLYQFVLPFLSAFFCFLSFFTKQDGGAFALLICGSLLLYHSITSRQWKQLVVFGATYVLVAGFFILPLLKYDFGYWFNYGQEPHYSRVSAIDFLSALLGKSEFLKIYLVIITLIVLSKIHKGLHWIQDKKFVMHLILTMGIWGQAAILQVTSYVPADGNIYYHSFMILFILVHLPLGIDLSRLKVLVPLLVSVIFWWSGLYWKYLGRMMPRLFEKKEIANVVSSSSYVLSKDTMSISTANWQVGEFREFKKIKLPVSVLDGIATVKNWYESQGGGGKPRVLNMSELTPLASILNYELERDIPLWYHLNVGMFDQEMNQFIAKIEGDHYDLVLFENIPQLNNFYPFPIRESLRQHYQILTTFQAPRDFKNEIIEVYIKKDEKNPTVKLDELP